MDRALPPPLCEHGMPPPHQVGYLPSPVTPSQSSQHPMDRDRERSCIQFLDDLLASHHGHIQWLEKAHRRDIEVIVRQSHEINDLKLDRQQLNILTEEHKRMRSNKQELITSLEQKLKDLDEQHADTLAQAVNEVKSQADKMLEVIRKEVNELNDALQREKVGHEEELDGFKNKLISLREESAEATATTARFEAKCTENSAATPTARINYLETQAVAAKEAFEQTEERLRAENAILEATLDLAERDVKTFLQEIETLATQKKIEKINRERAEAAQAVAEEAIVAHKKEIEELRENNLQLEDADLAVNNLQKDVRSIAQQHTVHQVEVSGLKADIHAKMILLASNQKDLDERDKELADTRMSLEERSTEAKDLQARNGALMAELKKCRELSSELDTKLNAAKDAFKGAEDKRQKESVSA